MLEGGGTHQQQHHNPQSPDMDSLLHYRFENNISFDDEHYCNTYYYGTEPHFSMITSPQENLVGQLHSISDYDLGAEGDLFNAPEPVLEERISPMLNPLTTALSMKSCGEDQSRNDENHLNHNAASTMEDINGGGATDHLLFSDVYYDCEKDLLENTVIEDTFPELADIKFPALDMGEDHHRQDEIFDTVEGPMQKSVSYQSLANTDEGGGGRRGIKNPSFVDFQEMDLGAAFKLRRTHSEGDIKTLGNGNKTTVGTSFDANILQPRFDRMLTVDDYKMEERRQKLSRYRKKKKQRNFGRKIKYACRKALADNQPRVRGRFARTEKCKLFK